MSVRTFDRQLPTGQRQLPTGQRQLPTGQRPLPTGQRHLPSGQVPQPRDSALRCIVCAVLNLELRLVHVFSSCITLVITGTQTKKPHSTELGFPFVLIGAFLLSLFQGSSTTNDLENLVGNCSLSCFVVRKFKGFQ